MIISISYLYFLVFFTSLSPYSRFRRRGVVAAERLNALDQSTDAARKKNGESSNSSSGGIGFFGEIFGGKKSRGGNGGSSGSSISAQSSRGSTPVKSKHGR